MELSEKQAEITRQLMADVLEPERLSAGDHLLIQSLALVTALIQQEPVKARPSLISQQRQLLGTYARLRKPDLWEI